MVIRVYVGVLSTQKRQNYPYYSVLDWNKIPLYTIMRVIEVLFSKAMEENKTGSNGTEGKTRVF